MRQSLILALLLPLSMQAAIVRVGHAVGASLNGFGTSITVAYAPTSTNTVFVAATTYRTAPPQPTVPAVSDGGTNTYTLVSATAGSNPQFDGASSTAYLFVNRNVTGGSFTYTFSFTTAAWCNIFVVEYSGLSGTVDGFNSNSGSAPTLTSGTITTTNAADLLFAVFSSSENAVVPGFVGTGGWAVIDQTNTTTQTPGATMELIVSSTGTYAATATLASSTKAYAGEIAATKSAVAVSNNHVSVTIQ